VDELRAMLAAAARVARARGDRQIEVEHLLLGLLSDPASEAGRTLGALGVDAKAVEVELGGLLDATLPH
jgi:ATP-dependent Clp protease ATP-binding subunit ClpA